MPKASHDLESMLRKIEVQYLYDDPKDVFTLDELAEISAIFMDQSVRTRDWRYLNAALKINDLLRTRKHTQINILAAQEAALLEDLRRFCELT